VEYGSTETLVGRLDTARPRLYTDLHAAAGSFDLTIDSMQDATFAYVMAVPQAGDVTGGRLYLDAPSAGGETIVDLYASRSSPDAGTNVIAGAFAFPDATGAARLLAKPEQFFVDYATQGGAAPAEWLRPGIECAGRHAPPIEGVWSGAILDTSGPGAPVVAFTVVESMNVNPPFVGFRSFAKDGSTPMPCSDISIGASVKQGDGQGEDEIVRYDVTGRYEGTSVTLTFDDPDDQGELDGRVFAGTDTMNPYMTARSEGNGVLPTYTVQFAPNEFRGVFGGIWHAVGDPEHVIRFSTDGNSGNSYTASVGWDLQYIEVKNGQVVREWTGTFSGNLSNTGPEITTPPFLYDDDQGVPRTYDPTGTFIHANRFVWEDDGERIEFIRAGS
jgi:hypothetical protein